MASVTQFAQHLLRLDPQRNSARLALFNYMKHVIEPSQPFTPELIAAFYARVLQFDQWQTDALILSETVRGDIASFLKHHATQGEIEQWRELRHPDTLQIVPLKLYQDLETLVLSEHETRQKSGDQIKCIKISDNQCLVLILSPGGTLEVKVYPAMAIINGARLKAVTPTSHLFYSSDLELMPHVRQILEGSLLTIHCFELTPEGVQGLITRGASFQKFETFIRAKLNETQDLFFSLKKLERHFINPQTDPYYQELIGRLERANRLLSHPGFEALEEAERALNRGRSALRNIFPNDRLLTLLVTHLEYGIQQRREPPQGRDATQ